MRVWAAARGGGPYPRRTRLQFPAPAVALKFRSACPAAAIVQSRSAISLPQIPGIICVNKEIPDDIFVSRIRKWTQSSEVLTGSAFDLLQICEDVDGRRLPRAVCGVLRTELLLAQGEKPVKAFVTVFYKGMDFLNKEFWEEQAKRLSDTLADQYLEGERGVQLTVHHNTPAWALGLEIGDHRLLAEFEALHVFGNPLARFRSDSVKPEKVEAGSCIGGEPSIHVGFNRINHSALEATSLETESSAPRGSYVLRDDSGKATCGAEVLGVLPRRLVLGGIWAAAGCEPDFGHLVDGLRRKAQRPTASIIADPRDQGWQRLCGLTSAPLPGIWRSRQRLGVAITGMPVGLSEEEQVLLAKAPFLIPWEFVPFHFGRFVLI